MSCSFNTKNRAQKKVVRNCQGSRLGASHGHLWWKTRFRAWKLSTKVKEFEISLSLFWLATKHWKKYYRKFWFFFGQHVEPLHQVVDSSTKLARRLSWVKWPRLLVLRGMWFYCCPYVVLMCLLMVLMRVLSVFMWF